MKPDWDDAPEWAKYLAQDECGTWRWYMFQPWPEVNVQPGFWESRRQSTPACKGKPNVYWKDTLEARHDALLEARNL